MYVYHSDALNLPLGDNIRDEGVARHLVGGGVYA